jgi:hypothetical protein
VWKLKPCRRKDNHPNQLRKLQAIQRGKPYKVLTEFDKLSKSRVIETEFLGGQKMREKANASGNAEDRGSRFAPDRKESRLLLGLIRMNQ